MTESRTTDPVFPPGRYGRRRDGRRHRLAPVVVGILVIAACALLAVKLYRQYGTSTYDAQIVGWSDVTDTSLTIQFRVQVPAGGTARCALRARTYDGVEVGTSTVTVRAAPGARELNARAQVPTTARPAVGEVLRCGPAR